jgi:hypothetical protein
MKVSRAGLIAIAVFAVLFARCEVGFCRSPVWLKEGVYFDYSSETADLVFSNGTRIISQCKAVLEWKCLNINVSKALLNVTLTFNYTIRYSTSLYVDVETENVILLNGTGLGKTFLWMPSDPYENQTLALTGSVTAKAHRIGWMATCQGAQKSFWARNMTASMWGGYDLDTGILIQSSFHNEPALLALGVSEIGGAPTIAATNADLGPREWITEITMAITYLLPVLAIVTVSLAIYFKRRQKRKNTNNRRKR